jgi:thiol:disulfide interchange protein DsbD
VFSALKYLVFFASCLLAAPLPLLAQAPSKIEVHVQRQDQGAPSIQVKVQRPGEAAPQVQAPVSTRPQAPAAVPSPAPAQVPAQAPASVPSPAAPQHFTTGWRLFHLTPQDQARSGTAPYLAVFLLTPENGWHAYSNNPGGTGRPTELAVRLMPGGRRLPVLYPPGEKARDLAQPSQTVNIYQGQTPLFVPLELPADGKFSLNAKLRLLLCSEKNCLPSDTESMFLGAGVNLGSLSSPASEPWWPLFLDLAKGAAGASPASGAGGPGGSGAAAPGASPAVPASAPPLGVQDNTARPGPAQPAPALAQAMEEALAQAAGDPSAPDLDRDFAPPASWDFAPRSFRPQLEVSTLVPAVLLGLLAGFLLNFMPCVLPVVCLKLSALMAAPSRDCPACPPTETLFKEHNLFFALGVLVYFLLISIVLGYTGLAWGQIFQTPGLVLGLLVLVFALSLSLFGLYTLPMIDLKRSGNTGQSPRGQAFFTGFLATLLATPCSGPFLGGVLSWALLQPPYVVSSVFMSIGLGMAAPYILMTYFPGLVRFFPKPGAWTLAMEKAVAFFLLGTCIYLANILPRDLTVPALMVLWLTGLAGWAFGASASFGSRLNMLALRAGAVAVLAAGFWLALTPAAPRADWEPFEPVRFQAMLGKKRLLVDFTAEWCPTCKVLEQTVLTRENLTRLKDRHGLTLVRVDLTESDPAALALLKSLGSRSIPLAAIFEPGERSREPLVIRDLFTAGQLEEALAGR